MRTPVSSVTRAARRRPGDRLNVLTCPTHERYETNLCRTGHTFWAVRHETVKDWNRAFAPVPPNYVLLDPALGERQLPRGVDFDLVLSQNRFGQYQLLSRVAAALHLPLLCLEHTLPHPEWGPEQLAAVGALRGRLDVFISDFSRRAWGWGEGEAEVVRHGVDGDTFRPLGLPRERFVLTVANDIRRRAWCCGWDFQRDVTAGLPHVHLGSSHDGWSRPADGVAGLVSHYNRCAVFLDPANASPVPSVLLEAMACGAVVVTRGNAMVPEFVRDGVNGFVCPDERAARARVEQVLADPDGFAGVGRRAAETVRAEFSLARFCSDWERVLERAAGIVYTG